MEIFNTKPLYEKDGKSQTNNLSFDLKKKLADLKLMIQAFTLRKQNGKSRLNQNLTGKKMNNKVQNGNQ